MMLPTLIEQNRSTKHAPDHPCNVCFKESTTRCGYCNVTTYCSEEHAFQDWKIHKRICKGLANPKEDAAVGAMIPTLQYPVTVMRKTWGLNRTQRLTDPANSPDKYPDEVRKLTPDGTFVIMKKNVPGFFYGKHEEMVAVKMVAVPAGDPLTPAVLRSLDAGRNLFHPNVLSTCAVSVDDKSQLVKTVANAAEMTLTDLIDHSMRERAQNNCSAVSPFDRWEMQLLAYQLVRAVAYCHSKGTVLVTLSPDTIHVSGRKQKLPSDSSCPELPGNFKQLTIAVLDDAQGFYTGPFTRPSYQEEITETCPPEYLANSGAMWTTKTDRGDVWRVGCCLFQMMTGQRLFSSKDPTELARQHQSFEGPSGFKEMVSDRLQAEDTAMDSILYSMLRYRPQDRCTIFEVLNSIFVSGEARKAVDSVLRAQAIVPLGWMNTDEYWTPFVAPESTLAILRDRMDFDILNSKSRSSSLEELMPLNRVYWGMVLNRENHFKYSLDIILHAMAIARNYFIASGEGVEWMPVNSEVDQALARACVTLADRWRNGFHEVVTPAVAKATLAIGRALDYTVGTPSAADFINAFAKIYKFDARKTALAKYTYLFSNLKKPLAFNGSLEEEVLACMAYVSGDVGITRRPADEWVPVLEESIHGVLLSQSFEPVETMIQRGVVDDGDATGAPLSYVIPMMKDYKFNLPDSLWKKRRVDEVPSNWNYT